MIEPAKTLHLTVLAGDGIGPEVTRAALNVLTAALPAAGVELVTTEQQIGGVALEETGNPLPAPSLQSARGADAVLLGAVGGPEWDRAPVRPEAGLLRLRSGVGAFANLRPVRSWPGLVSHSPLRGELLRGVDILFIRELTGGIYFGKPKGISGNSPHRHAVDTSEYGEAEVRRTAEVAFQAARGRRSKVTSVDKANVLATSQLWREVITEVGGKFPDVALEHFLVDSFALRLLQRPGEFDVVVTENLFGDILTDEAAALSGSLGVLPSASGGGEGPWLYEPVHGSAPDLAGRGIANPIGAILTIALLLRLTLQLDQLAGVVERAVEAVIAEGRLTPDLGGHESTDSVTEAVIGRLAVGAKA
ncbi:MAG: 3-isopropylmalate dehydrogenase [Candidatus Dormibacteria bacterium]